MVRHEDQGGFSIIELLVSLSVLAIIIPVLTIGITSLVRLNDRARDLSLISVIAENKIESLRSIGYNSIAVNPSVDFSNELPSTLAPPKSASYSVVESSGNKRIEVSISYTDDGVLKNIKYASVVSETGIAQ